jgi:hypothetical protein
VIADADHRRGHSTAHFHVVLDFGSGRLREMAEQQAASLAKAG